MSMGASIVTYSVHAANADELRRRVVEYLVPAARAAQGYRGFLLLDLGDDKRLAVLLFDSVQEAQAAQRAIGPVGAERTYALMSSPAVGALGTAIVVDGMLNDKGKGSPVITTPAG